MEAVLVDGLADPMVLLQQGLRGVLIMAKVFTGDQAVRILQPGNQVVHLGGELKKIEGLLEMAETLRRLVLQPLPLVLQLQDVLLDPWAEASLTQKLLPLFDGVLPEQERDKRVQPPGIKP